jgi:tetratricopeptide (TPR) repeat protein
MNWIEIGNNFYVAKKYSEAKGAYLQAVEANKTDLTALHNLGLTCHQLGEFENAIKFLDLPCANGSSGSLLSRGVVFRELGRYQNALNDFMGAILTDTKSSAAYSNYANSLREFCLPEQSIPFLKTAQKLDPTAVNPHLNESIAYLTAGDLLKGWEKYDYRWFYETGASLKPKLDKPEWDGSQSLAGKTILIYNEQGFGDSIQFCRYVRMVQQLGATVILAVRPPIFELFSSNFTDIQVIPSAGPLPEFDYHIGLLGLPVAFKTSMGTIPNSPKYLSADKEHVAFWKEKLGKKTKKRVGIIWSSNKAAWTSRFRKIDLAALAQITSDDFEFISLSMDATDEETQILKKHNIIHFDKEMLAGFDTTAGLIENLDLVITIDTVIAHLAPALGCKTWVMLAKYGVDWRWFLDREDSPFYPTVRLFRQPNYDDWASCLSNIKSALEEFKNS